jgi:hypothetical protein
VVESEKERAQLWALYFQTQAATRPPRFVLDFEDQLRQHLAIDEPDPDLTEILSRGHLRRVQ